MKNYLQYNDYRFNISSERNNIFIAFYSFHNEATFSQIATSISWKIMQSAAFKNGMRNKRIFNKSLNVSKVLNFQEHFKGFVASI